MTLPFALENVRKVTFYKRDEITADLICCDVEVEDEGENQRWFNHEGDESWQTWIVELAALPNFDSDWFSKVNKPPFVPSVTVAYERTVA